MDSNPLRRQPDVEQDETDATRPLVDRHDQDYPSQTLTWKIFCIVYIAAVLILGTSLEAVRLLTSHYYLGFANYTVTNELLTYLYDAGGAEDVVAKTVLA
jgi:hypothetical protein